MNNRDWYKSFAKSMINDSRRIGCFSIACSTLAAALIASLCVKEDESASSPRRHRRRRKQWCWCVSAL